MYNNPGYGYGVYKKSQVNIGTPFAVQPPVETRTPPAPEEREGEASEFVSVDQIEKARREAEMILREARFEAERLMEEARAGIAAEAEESGRLARENGYAEGERQAQRQYAALVREAEETLESARTSYQETLAGMESDMVSLILEIAKKVIGTEIATQPESILGIIRTTMADVTPAEKAVVKVSPEDYAYVCEHLERLTSSLGNLCELDIRRDGTLQKGACLVDTGYGTADGSAQTRTAQIVDALNALLGGRSETPFTASVETEPEG